MRIAYVCESILPSRTANSLQVMRMCDALAAQGHDVVLLAPDRQSEAEPDVADVADFYGVGKRFRRESLPWLRGPWRALRTPAFSLAVARRVRRLRPDLVVSRSIHGGLGPAWREGRRLPVLLEAHAPIWEYSRLIAAALKHAARTGRVRKLIVVTQALKDAYVARGYFREQDVLVAPNGAPPAEAGDGTKLPGRPQALRAGYAGQLFPGKGMELIARLAARLPEVDFHVLGGMEEDVARWRGEIERGGHGGHVHFHGFVRQRELGRLLASLDVCLLPNQRKVQGFGDGRNRAIDLGGITSPLKMFEAMAHGKAIVCSDLPVLREVMNERNALLVPPEDLEGWVAAIRKLADPGLRAALGRQALADLERNYTVAARAARIVAAAVDALPGERDTGPPTASRRGPEDSR